MQVMSLNFALAQKENTSFTVDMHVIFHINDILNIYFIHVPNYTSSYSTVTSACQGSGLARTLTVSIFRTLTFTQTRFCHQ